MTNFTAFYTKIKKDIESDILFYLVKVDTKLSFFAVVFVRNRQFFSAFCTTCSQYSAAVCSSHSFTESVFVLSLSVRGLKRSFHRIYLFYVITLLSVNEWAKLVTFLE